MLGIDTTMEAASPAGGVQRPPNADAATGPVTGDTGRYTFSGPEPPRHVVRLGIIGPRNGQEAELNVARCADGGWWIMRYDDWPTVPKGWPWEDGLVRFRANVEMAQVFPRITDPSGDLAESLVTALPHNFVSYQVGVDEDGVPVWGWIDDDGEWDVEANETNPDD